MTSAGGMSDPQALADGWAECFNRSMWWMEGIPGARERALAKRLVYNLALVDLEWAHPIMREAARIRSEQIIAEIGWPKKAWLDKRVAAEIAHRNAVHAWAESGYAGEFPSRMVAA